jgi:hypothetical protein
MTDEFSGFDLWAKLNEQELLQIISHPEAYNSFMRSFAAQELSNRQIKNNDNSDSHFNKSSSVS